MWIAKPLGALNTQELRLTLNRRTAPLSQTLTWQQASLSMGARVYLILETNEQVGGFVHTFDGQNFDCTNGPVLEWDQPETASRHLATFAHAVSKLSPRFQSLSIAPRWESALASQRIQTLPIEPSDILEAATLQVPIEKTRKDQVQRATPRLRRTLARAEKAGVETYWSQVSTHQLPEFVLNMQQFGQHKGFYVPSLEWFQALVTPTAIAQDEGISFFLAEAAIRSNTPSQQVLRKTQLLIALTPHHLYYLFGCDVKNGNEHCPSTAASAHFRVLEESAKLGQTLYDLNGYTHPQSGEPSYRGVSLFKEQFGGQIVSYLCPQYFIST